MTNRTKGYGIRPTATALFEIFVHGGGVLPLQLRGRFTHRKYAQGAIDRYIQSLPKDLRPNGENGSPSNS